MRSRKSAPPASSPSRRAPERGWGRLGRIAWLAGVLLAPGALLAAEIEGRVNLPPIAVPPERMTTQRYELPPRTGSPTPAPKTRDGLPTPAPKSGVAYASDGTAMPNPRVAVVYLEGDFPLPAVPPRNERIEQKDLAFIPSFLAIRVGTKVEFPNLDDFYHNIFSNNQAKRFDLGRYRKDEIPPPQLFDKPGHVILRCDIHSNMRALIVVVPSPYFVVTDKEGRYRLTGVPPGKYKLKVWKDSNTTLEREVEIPATGSLSIDFP